MTVREFSICTGIENFHGWKVCYGVNFLRHAASGSVGKNKKFNAKCIIRCMRSRLMPRLNCSDHIIRRDLF